MIEVFLSNGFSEIDLDDLRYGWHGVYVLFNKRDEAIYVGQGNVGCRVRQHNYRRSRTKWWRAVAVQIKFGASALEAELIRLLKPRFNIGRGAFRRQSKHPIVSAIAQPALSEAKAS